MCGKGQSIARLAQ